MKYLVLFLLLLLSCKKESAQSSSDLTPLKQSFRETDAKIAFATYEDSLIKAQKLQSEIQQFVQKPTADGLINEPFFVINGDDFYGEQTFKVAANFYNGDKDDFSMVAFRLDKTLSEFGGVTRGLCEVKDNCLATIVETGDLQKEGDRVSSDRDIELNGSEPVSMNMWGYTPRLFLYLKDMFVDFLQEEGTELKSEFLIPTVINNLIQTDRENVAVLQSDARWFGVTYKDDKPYVVEQLQKLTDAGTYPNPLF